MVTIHNLEVTFDVEGERQEKVFTELFQKHIREWSRMEEQNRAQRRLADAERSLGDRETAEEGTC